MQPKQNFPSATGLEPSPTLLRFSHLIAEAPGPILDAACGFGRHSLLLASLGCSVVAVDIDMARLKTLEKLKNEVSRTRGRSIRDGGKISVVRFDLSLSQWPFKSSAFGAVVVVHFLSRSMLANIDSVLCAGGLLYIETFGGHGANYLDLPRAGAIKRALQDHYDFDYYLERKVGPANADAVSVRLFARRRRRDGSAALGDLQM